MQQRMSRKIFAFLGTFVAAGALVPSALATTTEDTSAHPTADGLTSQTAAASCYEIKQNNPDVKSGKYWLYTPGMSAPAEFYCDQETNGGGWVLIGRGRQGWTDEYAGRGKADDLANNPDGTDAFSLVQLSSKTVDALLGDKGVEGLGTDGLRVHRAQDTAGKNWQDITLKRNKVTNWSWQIGYNGIWSNIKVSSPSTGNTTYDAAINDKIFTRSSDVNDLVFAGNKATGWNNGFSYGASVTGSSAADSYLWSATEGGGNATGFAQVYVRPTLTQSILGLSTIADSGTAASENKALPQSGSEKVLWRTSDQIASGSRNELNTYVQAIDQVGNTVFTAGNFKYVENAQTGEQVQQSYIAGYDVNTGELVRTFMPKFNGQIKALAALPNGKLAVGGEFTQVNGEAVSNLVVLDPVTGEIDKTWDWKIENRNTGGVVKVKTLDVQGNYLYVGGDFTHVKGNTSSVAAYSKNATRFNLSNGSVDWKWRPIINGSLSGISANEAGTDVYASGYFSTVGGEDAYRIADINTTDGKLARNWSWTPSIERTIKNNAYQLDVKAGADRVWVGGSEHHIHSYNQSDLSRVSSSIARNGGDFQDILINNGVTYGSCHCGDAIYEGSSSYGDPFNQSTNVEQVRLVAAFDEETGKAIPEFNPQISGAKGFGVWEQFVDSNGNLWVGGDINRTKGTNGATQATVGFARFAPRDVTPPATPTNFAVSSQDGKDKLTWARSAESGVTYQILRNDRVIATTKSTSFSIDHEDGARYFVRAADSAGNYSASTAVAVAPVTPEPTPSASASSAAAEPTSSASATASPSASASASPSATSTTSAAATVKQPVTEEAPAAAEQPAAEAKDVAAN